MNQMLSFVILGIFTGASAWFIFQSSKRQVSDVLADLLDGSELPRRPTDADESSSLGARSRFSDQLGRLGLVERQERRLFRLEQRIIPPACGFGLGLLGLLFGLSEPGSIIPLLVGGTAFGYLFSKHRVRALRKRYIRSLEYSLPIVMERIVMAVQSGLDIIPALQRIVDSAPQTLTRRREPVVNLLKLVCQMTDRGLTLPYALSEVAEWVDCPAVRHAFIHLAVAHQEGGELVAPLRELSDASQLQYQESIEEEIAALPIKATMPLLCTFAGLILIFITAPIVQVITLTAEAIPK